MLTKTYDILENIFSHINSLHVYWSQCCERDQVQFKYVIWLLEHKDYPIIRHLNRKTKIFYTLLEVDFANEYTLLRIVWVIKVSQVDSNNHGLLATLSALILMFVEVYILIDNVVEVHVPIIGSVHINLSFMKEWQDHNPAWLKKFEVSWDVHYPVVVLARQRITTINHLSHLKINEIIIFVKKLHLC